jgi:endogenous inhibitor of DNA gyrase (YacG/DUF329 family)
MANKRLNDINDLYKCPICGDIVVLHIKTTYAPLCNNRLIHSCQSIEMLKQNTSSTKEN